MSDQLVIESPDFDQIRKLKGGAIEDAIRLVWFSLNEEISLRRQAVRQVRDMFQPKVRVDTTTSSQNNYDADGLSVVYFTGASNIDLTGIRNGYEGSIRIIYATGAGTITVKNQSASSDAANRIITQSAGDVSVTTNKAIILVYLASRWREAKLA